MNERTRENEKEKKVLRSELKIKYLKNVHVSIFLLVLILPLRFLLSMVQH